METPKRPPETGSHAKTAQTPRKRRPLSQEHRQRLREAQLAYVQNDPRWTEHREKLAAAQKRAEQRATLAAKMRNYIENDPRWPDHRARMMDAADRTTRLTLLPEEVEQFVALRKKGRNLEYIAEELCVSRKVIQREIKALGIEVTPAKIGPTIKRGKGFWRSFD